MCPKMYIYYQQRVLQSNEVYGTEPEISYREQEEEVEVVLLCAWLNSLYIGIDYNSLLPDRPNGLVGWVDCEVGRLATPTAPVDQGPSRGSD